MSRFRSDAATPAAIVPASGASTSSPVPGAAGPRAPLAPVRAGVICNPRSHQNLRAAIAHREPAPDVVLAAPRTHGELAATLAEFAARGIDLLVIDGGDGTVRDVLTAAAEAFGDVLPQIAILPNGKTNALALDLGVPDDWTLEAALAAVQAGAVRRRAPLVVERDGAPALHGFLLGAGGFVRATELAQRTHRVGAFHGLAVALSTVWSILQALFGRADGEWRRGDPMRIAATRGAAAGETLTDGATFFFLTSTLERLPVGLKPLGPVRRGLKALIVPAPPRWMALAVLPILLGQRGGWLERNGYRHRDLTEAHADIAGGFILDGDYYDDERVTLREGAPIAFVVP